MGGGIGVFDYDGDGNLDLFFANGGALPSGKKTSPAHANTLLRNLGNFRFQNVTAAAGLAGSEFSFAAAVDDFNADGRPDLLVTTIRGVILYRNEGNGKFTDITSNSGIDNHGRWAVGAAWLDYDLDGDRDLFVVNYLQWEPASEPECRTAGRIDFCHPKYYQPQPNALFRNNGNGTFTDVSEASGIASHKGKGMGVAVADFDHDGRPDIFVTNDRMPAFLFRNRPDGRFDEVAFDFGVAVPPDGKPVSGMGTDTQDIDGDGKPDIVYTALKDETFPLLRSTGDDFEDITMKTRLGPLSRRYPGWGVQFADLDNDGRIDIVAATSDALSGKVDPSRKGQVVWFRKSSDGTFSVEELTKQPAMYRGVVAADLNADGCLDLVVTALDTPAQILRRPCSGKATKITRRQPTASSTLGYASSLWFGGR